MNQIKSQIILTLIVFIFNCEAMLSQNTITLSEGTVLTVSTISTDVTTPWEIVSRPDNKIWVTERNLGFISEFDIVTGVKRIIYEIPLSERVPPEFAGVGGTMGMVLHPDFDSGTPEVYVSLTNQDFVYALYKYTYDGSTFINREVVLTTALASGNTGSRLMIGEDRTIYMTTGGENDENPQLLTNRVGKILRINLDGSAPTDNPFYDSENPTSNQSYIYSYGHRNPQGITEVPSTDPLLGGAIFSAEHGEVQNDEVNRIIAGHNYGWADYEGWTAVSSDDNHPPLVTFDLAPTGLQWYDHPAIPEWSRKLLMGTSKGGVLMVWTPTADGNDLLDRNPAGASSNNVNITEQNTFSFTFGSTGTSPRCITPLPDGRIIIGAFSNPHRIIMLENQDYNPGVLSWTPTTLEFGDLEGGIHNANAILTNNTESLVEISSIEISNPESPFSITSTFSYPTYITAGSGISVGIQFEAYSEDLYTTNLIATSDGTAYTLNLNAEISLPTNDNLLTLNEGTELTVSTLTTDVSRPWDLKLENNEYLWVTERDLGTVSRININTGVKNTVLTLNPEDLPPAVGSTAGLLGMALHPNFSSDKPWVYLAHTNSQSQQSLSRFTWNGTSLIDKQVLLSISDTPNLFGSRLAFLPDQTLLWTTAADNSDLAQNVESLAGKIIRLTDIGGVPDDNPFAQSTIESERYIYTLGHRNAQGLTTWTDSENQIHVMISEHGQEENDEINLIIAGDNYGWPNYEGKQISTEENHAPQVTFDLAPTGMDYYNHPAIPEWENTLLLGSSKGRRLLVLSLDDDLEIEDHNILAPRANTLNLHENNNFLFFSNGHTDRPRDVEVSEDGRIFLAMFGGAGEDRILILENESYEESLTLNDNFIRDSQVFPNPANNFINIITNETVLNKLFIYDINGREMNFATSANGKTINTSNLSPGLYILVVKLQKKNKYYKFIKK